MRQPKSDIPANVVEQLVQEYKEEGPLIYFRITHCLLNSELVGRRAFNRNGQLVIETPLKNGLKHGREITWNDDGSLLLIEPFIRGKQHGIAKQYGAKGHLIGTYRCVHGTGLDVWRHEDKVGDITVSEIHTLEDGMPHGFEWWFSSNQLWHERHWYLGQPHGIERMWNNQGKLNQGYPKYWIAGQMVTERKYIQHLRTNTTAPPFREKDNAPRRKYPPEIEHVLSK